MEMQKKLVRYTTEPSWPKRYPTTYDIVVSNKTQGEDFSHSISAPVWGLSNGDSPPQSSGQEAQQDPDDDTNLGGEVKEHIRWENHLTDVTGQAGRVATKKSMKFN
ncbi:hypothetical protein BTVI_09211 [Pitangus sulphuratus]|nr:hypothetical protein BTVI_09211 [Pitangus sulphuratus]